MSPTVDIGFSICARPITNRQIHHSQIELGGCEDQVEISERIELPEISAVLCNRLVIFTEKYFGSTKRILEFLAEQPTESYPEQLFATMLRNCIASASIG